MQSRPRPPLRVHPSAIHDQIHRSRPRHRGLERTRACGRTKAPRSRRRAKKQTHSAGSSGSCTCRPRGSRRSRAAPERRSRPARPPGGCRAWLRLRRSVGPEVPAAAARSYTLTHAKKEQSSEPGANENSITLSVNQAPKYITVTLFSTRRMSRPAAGSPSRCPDVCPSWPAPPPPPPRLRSTPAPLANRWLGLLLRSDSIRSAGDMLGTVDLRKPVAIKVT